MVQLPPGFTSHSALVKDIRMHYVLGGSGEPVVIVHGGWDSWWAWRHVARALAEQYTVILPALRGLGKTSKPMAGYDADNLGDDLHQLMTHLGHDRFALVGHDWGAVAGYALAAQGRETVEKLAIFEMVIPGVGIMEQAMVPQPGGQYLWHMGFQSIPDIPELLIRDHLPEYMHWFFTYFAAVPDAVDEEARAHYVDLYQQVGAMRAFMEYYKSFWLHADQVREHMRQKLSIPVLAYGGDACLGGLTKQCMTELADDVRGGVIPECGHWIAEEQPDFVLARLREFLAGADQDPGDGPAGESAGALAAAVD